MNYFLDTNICVDFFRNKNKELTHKILSLSSNIKISSIVVAELLHGANKSSTREKNVRQVEDFLANFEIISFGFEAAYIYGEIKAKLELTGNIIGPNDLLIAASVLAENGILVTNNTREFSRIEGLSLEDWLN